VSRFLRPHGSSRNVVRGGLDGARKGQGASAKGSSTAGSRPKPRFMFLRYLVPTFSASWIAEEPLCGIIHFLRGIRHDGRRLVVTRDQGGGRLTSGSSRAREPRDPHPGSPGRPHNLPPPPSFAAWQSYRIGRAKKTGVKVSFNSVTVVRPSGWPWPGTRQRTDFPRNRLNLSGPIAAGVTADQRAPGRCLGLLEQSRWTTPPGDLRRRSDAPAEVITGTRALAGH